MEITTTTKMLLRRLNLKTYWWLHVIIIIIVASESSLHNHLYICVRKYFADFIISLIIEFITYNVPKIRCPTYGVLIQSEPQIKGFQRKIFFSYYHNVTSRDPVAPPPSLHDGLFSRSFYTYVTTAKDDEIRILNDSLFWDFFIFQATPKNQSFLGLGAE